LLSRRVSREDEEVAEEVVEIKNTQGGVQN
jgi:hypothetical protein